MKSISNIWIVLSLLLSMTAFGAQIKNSKTETVQIYGNCDKCKAAIEMAGNIKKIAEVSWDKDTKIASITYDEKKTNQDEILKRIALSGYDNIKFLAPDVAYAKLENCCQYERANKIVVKAENPTIEMKSANDSAQKTPMETQEINQMIAVFDHYFEIKDALVQTNGAMASAKSANLLKAITDVKMEKMSMDVHMVWMKVLNDLQEDAEHISDTKDASHQRDHFMSLSKNIYAVMKVSKTETPTYYQFCPMANSGKGANWLSKENVIKNPYFGSKMLSCGKTLETIK